MPTMPEEPPIPLTLRERVREVVAAPIAEKQRPVTILAISAGLAALAPIPFGPLAASLLVIVASERVRR